MGTFGVLGEGARWSLNSQHRFQTAVQPIPFPARTGSREGKRHLLPRSRRVWGVSLLIESNGGQVARHPQSQREAENAERLNQ